MGEWLALWWELVKRAIEIYIGLLVLILFLHFIITG